MTPTTFPNAPSDALVELARVADDLFSLVGSLSDDDLRAPHVAGEWRGQDILAHLARWDAIACHAIQAEHDGQPAGHDYANYLELNDEWAALDQAIGPDQARARFEAAHAALFALLSSLPPDDWTPLVRRWAKNAVWRHYPEHTAHLRTWRDEQRR